MKNITKLTVIMVIILVIFTGCKSKKIQIDIRGNWSMTFIMSGQTMDMDLYFSGSITGGTVNNGEWTLNNNQVNMSFYSTGDLLLLSGTVYDNSMSGNGTFNYNNYTYGLTWTAVRK